MLHDPPVQPRPATAADVPEVLRLAAVMYESIGQTVEEPWFRAAGRLLERRLGEGRTAVFVIDAAETGRLASCVAATIGERLPGPAHPQGIDKGSIVGSIQWMCTDPAYRRRGLGRAVLVALLDWLWANGAGGAELNASDEGEPLYRSLGFVDAFNPQLRTFAPRASGRPPGPPPAPDHPPRSS